MSNESQVLLYSALCLQSGDASLMNVLNAYKSGTRTKKDMTINLRMKGSAVVRAKELFARGIAKKHGMKSMSDSCAKALANARNKEAFCARYEVVVEDDVFVLKARRSKRVAKEVCA